MSVIYIEKTDVHSTLTTWIYCAFWQMWAAEQQGSDVYINWPKGKSLIDLKDESKFREVPNMFEWYFKQPKVDFVPERHQVWTWEHWMDTSPVPFMAQPLEVIRAYYQKHLHFSDAVNVRGQALADKYGIDFSQTIGITWRGTDIYLESNGGFKGRTYTEIEKYYRWIDMALEQTPDARIACTAEEQGILDPLLARYPQAFVIDEFVSAPRGGKHNPERFMDKSGFERGMQPALMVWFFSKCAWYIRNRSSSGAIAGWLNTGNVVSVGFPANLGFPVNIDGDEYNGKIYGYEL